MQTASSTATALPVSWSDLATHRDALVRFARRKLLDPALAEDLVHDVFEAVISGRAAFAGRSALRSWLIGILKHKIVDLVRQRVGHHSLPGEDEAGFGAFENPAPGPDEVAEQRERLARTLAAIETLTPGLRDVIRLRVLEDRSTADVCRALSITEDNLFVRLHRARRQLLQ
jgi:RNA polymerase sigma-70 factor (ECF subfamily)